MSTGRSIDWSRTARSLENHHLRSRPTQQRNGRTLRFRWADERANLHHIYSTRSGPDARSPRYRHHGQSCGSQGRWRAPGNRSGGRAPAISAAVFAGLQSDRTGLQQSEIKAAQGRRAHSQRTLSQNRPDFPLLQNSRMYKFLQARGVRVNVSGICSRSTQSVRATSLPYKQKFINSFQGIAFVLYGTIATDIRIKPLEETHEAY